MQLCPACLLVLGAALGVSVPGGCCGSHSLHYFYLRLLEPSQELPLFFIRGYLNDQPISRYDSLTRSGESLVSWMEEVEKETFLSLEWVFRSELEKLSRLNHPTNGLHTWQVILGCELREDGNKGGVFRYGYNGVNFISFQKETLTWVAAQPQARKVKEKWEEDPRWSQKNKVYLEETCIVWLQRYLSYRKKALRKTESPVGKVTHKVVDDSLEVLICQVFGFYPKEIQATWTRDGENWEQETFRRTVAPNSDGTYYVWISIEIDPKERDRFRCHLEHDALQEPLILALKDKTATEWRIPVGTVVGVTFGAVIFFLMYYEIQSEAMLQSEVTSEDTESYGEWRPQRVVEDSGSTLLRREGKLDDFPSQILSSSLNCGTDYEIQSEAMLQSEVTSEGTESYGEWSPQRVLENSGSTLRRREGTQQSLRKSMSWAGELETLDKAEATESKEGRLLGFKAEEVTVRDFRAERRMVSA